MMNRRKVLLALTSGAASLAAQDKGKRTAAGRKSTKTPPVSANVKKTADAKLVHRDAHFVALTLLLMNGDIMAAFEKSKKYTDLPSSSTLTKHKLDPDVFNSARSYYVSDVYGKAISNFQQAYQAMAQLVVGQGALGPDGQPLDPYSGDQCPFTEVVLKAVDQLTSQYPTA